MTARGDMDHEMLLLPLDGETPDRLLAGWVAPEDAPPGYAPVVRLLDAASAEAGDEELEREHERVAAVALAVCSSAPRKTTSRPSALPRARLAAAIFAVAVAASAGMASTGLVPGAVHDLASTMLAKLGLPAPGPSDRAEARTDLRGGSEPAANAPLAADTWSEVPQFDWGTASIGVDKGAALSQAAGPRRSQTGHDGSAEPSAVPAESGTGPSAPSAAGNGNEEASQAPDAEASGGQQGAVISSEASKGKSQAGQNGPASGAGNGNGPASGAGNGNVPDTNPGGEGGPRDTRGGRDRSRGKSNASAPSGDGSPAGPAETPDRRSPGAEPALFTPWLAAGAVP